MQKTTKTDPIWINKIVRYTEESPESLQGNPFNFRTHPKFQRDSLVGAMDDLGWIAPVIVNDVTKHCIDGHLRISLAIERRLKTIPVIYVSLTEDEEKEAIISYDALTSLAVADKEKLDGLLREIPPVDARLQEMLAGLAKQEGLYQVPSQKSPEPEINRADELREKWGTAFGQLWEIPSKIVLGKGHRLLCGDSMRRDEVELLIDGEKADACITDPPYGVQIADWDENIPPQHVLDLCFETVEGTVIWFGAATMKSIIPTVAYIPPPERIIVWFATFSLAKTAANGMFYRWHPIWCWKLPKSQEIINRDVIECNTETIHNDFSHPGKKPLKLICQLVEAFGGTRIYDPFLGPGTTMIAAEQLGRLCYGMEISPEYVAVILERMAEMGLEPKLVS